MSLLFIMHYQLTNYWECHVLPFHARLLIIRISGFLQKIKGLATKAVSKRIAAQQKVVHELGHK